jgi:hypothetical protein
VLTVSYIRTGRLNQSLLSRSVILFPVVIFWIVLGERLYDLAFEGF